MTSEQQKNEKCILSNEETAKKLATYDLPCDCVVGSPLFNMTMFSEIRNALDAKDSIIAELRKENEKLRCANGHWKREMDTDHIGTCDSYGICLACQHDYALSNEELLKMLNDGKTVDSLHSRISELEGENTRLIKLNAENSHEYNDECGCGFCYAMRQHRYIYEQLQKKLESSLAEKEKRITMLEGALKLCERNDKTVYDYCGHGKRQETVQNRFGEIPSQGRRFNTPAEIAREAISTPMTGGER